MLVGYAGVPTDGQELQPQLEALIAAGCRLVFSDTVRATVGERPHLEAALASMRPGDTLVVCKLDRLGRDVRGLVQFAAELSRRRLHLKVLADDIDTSNSGGGSFFDIMSSLADMERELMRERTLIGLAAARAKGKKPGRPPLTEEQRRIALRLFANPDLTMGEIARAAGCSVASLYRVFTAAERNRAGKGGRPPKRSAPASAQRTV